MSKYAIQMYSLREAISSQGFGCAIDIAGKMGWDGVEFAGFYDMPANELKSRLEKWGLTPLSSHVRLPLLTEKLDEIISYHKDLGVPYIICLNAPDWDNIEATMSLLRGIRDQVEAAGLTFLYHNHNHEFVPTDGVLPIDALKKEFSLELDTFWAWVAGEKMPDYILANSDRIKLLHIKDGELRDGTPRGGASLPLGDGRLPLKEILSTAKKIGADQWLIYENDIPENGAPHAEKSLTVLREMMSSL